MADLVQDFNFIYSRLKIPFTWYEASIPQTTEALDSLINGEFTSNLDGWTPSSGSWAWNASSGGIARWSSIPDTMGTLTQQYLSKPKLTFASIDIKAISGGFVVLKIYNSLTGAVHVTPNITTTGINTLTAVGDTIIILASGAVTIDVDDAIIIVLDNAAQLQENRVYCKDECPYKLHMGATTFLNFALVRKTVATDLTYIIFVHEDGTTIYFNEAQILSDLGITDPTFQDRSGQVWDYFIYHGQDHTRYFKCGYWKAFATDSAASFWYGETFYVGEYGAEEIPANNILTNPDFETDLSGWSVSGGAWTWWAGQAVGNGTGVCEQSLPGFPSLRKIRLKIKVTEVATTMAMFITNSGVTTAALIISDPGIYTLEAMGNHVYFSLSGTTAKVEWAYCYILNVNPNICHTQLTWKNSCDLFNLPYSNNFTNVLYIENPAITVAPGWKEEIEVVKDGAGRETKTAYRKMKDYLLETAEIPEYVYDSLSLMNAHNNVKISLPVYTGQKNIVIKDVELKNDWLDGECYASAAMRLLIEDLFDTSCCDSLNYQVACKEVCLTVASKCLDPGGSCSCAEGAFHLQIGVHEIFGCYLDGQLTAITTGMVPNVGMAAPYDTDSIANMFQACTSEVLILNEDDDLWYIWYGIISYPAIPVSLPVNDWKTIYEIISVTDDFGGCVTLVGLVPFWAFGFIEISTNAGMDWTEVAGPLTQAQLAAGYQVCGLSSGETLFRIHTKNLNCDYSFGASETLDISSAELRDDGGDELRDDLGIELRDV